MHYYLNSYGTIWLLLLTCGLAPCSLAGTLAVALSQEQDGGDAGRACIYVHQGQAEFRLVKAGESCPSQIVIENNHS